MNIKEIQKSNIFQSEGWFLKPLCLHSMSEKNISTPDASHRTPAASKMNLCSFIEALCIYYKFWMRLIKFYITTD